MQNTAMFYLQNCDLWNLIKKYQNFDFFQEKQKTMHPTKKKNIQWLRTLFHILHLCTKFQSPRSINIFFQNQFGALKITIYLVNLFFLSPLCSLGNPKMNYYSLVANSSSHELLFGKQYFGHIHLPHGTINVMPSWKLLKEKNFDFCIFNFRLY